MGTWEGKNSRKEGPPTGNSNAWRVSLGVGELDGSALARRLGRDGIGLGVGGLDGPALAHRLGRDGIGDGGGLGLGRVRRAALGLDLRFQIARDSELVGNLLLLATKGEGESEDAQRVFVRRHTGAGEVAARS